MNTTITLQMASRVIIELPKEFTLHNFIELYSLYFEREYVEMLSEQLDRNETAIFKTVHAHIGRFLSNNHRALKIIALGKQKSKNIHGIVDDVELWRKAD